MSRLRLHGPDAGASLLLVMAFMALIGVISLGLLGYSDISFQAHRGVKDARQANYAADAAVELGIRKVADDPTGLLGSPVLPCPTFTLTDTAGSPDSRVTCQADGAAGTPAGNRAANAILTRSTTVDLAAAGTQALTVSGNVYSHSGISVGPASNNRLDVVGALHAHANGDCTGVKVTATLGKACGAAATSAGAVPPWTSRAGTSFASTVVPNPLPVCSPTGHALATFAPGKYTVNPTTLLASVPTCTNRETLLFTAGVYYFENATFNTGDYDVVAGTPSGWAAAGGAPPADGSACLASAAGAQFLLGGSAAVTIPNQDSVFTLCAGPSPGTQPAIAVYGVRATGAGLVAQTAGTAFSTQNRPSVFVQGAIFMPSARAELTLHNKSRTYYVGGLVLNSLTASVSASSTQADSPIALPPCTTADPCQTNRRVVFTAFVGTETTPRTRAVVDFDDAFGLDPARDYTIDSWAVLR